MSAVLVGALLLAAVAGARGTWSPCGLSMISAINPIAERARGHRYGLTCAWFVLGAVAGGLLLGAGAALGAGVLALVGGLPAAVAAAVGALVALVCLGSDLRVPGLGLPGHPRQVDETWLGAYRRWVYAAGFGLQIGTGFATYVMTAATYLVAGLAVLTGRPLQALLVGVVFGLVRGAAVLLPSRVRTPAQLFALHRRLEAAGPLSLVVAMTAQALAAVGLAAAAVGPAGAAVAGLAVVGLSLAGRLRVRAPEPAQVA